MTTTTPRDPALPRLMCTHHGAVAAVLNRTGALTARPPAGLTPFHFNVSANVPG